MATAESVRRKIKGLIATANNVTGNNDSNLTDAVNALADGYEQAIDPVLEELTIKENGVYTPNTGVDGFSKVIAEVPSIISDGAKLLDSGTVAPAAGFSYLVQELSEVPDLVLIWAESEVSTSATVGWILGVLPFPHLPTDLSPPGAISNFVSALRYLNGNVTNNGEPSATAIYLTDGVPYFRAQQISASYPIISGNYVYKTYKLWD